MSASVANSAINITDTRSQIKNKVNRHAFSGGGATAELHKEHGGNTEVDVSFQYLTFFLDDDDEVADIERRYKSGELSTGDLKKRCIEVVADMLEAIQAVSLLNARRISSCFLASSAGQKMPGVTLKHYLLHASHPHTRVIRGGKP